MRARWPVVVALIAGCGHKGNTKGHGDDGGTGNADARAADAQPDAPPVDAVVLDAPPDAQVTAMMVGSAGGTLTTPDGVVLEIPPGALASMTAISITTGPAQGGVVSKVYSLEPDGTQFAVPVALTIPYDPSLLGATPDTDLALASSSGGGFSGAGWTLIDAARHVATGYIVHFSQWAITPSPPGGCTVNYGCWKTCTGSQIPDLCCSASRSTCRAKLTTSFPVEVDCYERCIGAPQVANFGNSACMASCCTGHGWTVMSQGGCYNANASTGEAQAVLDCARGCFTGPDRSTLCGSGTIQFDACSWQVTFDHNLGDECVGMAGGGVTSQALSTDLGGVYDQIWGNPQVIHVTGGTFDASGISIPLTCATSVSASGTIAGPWNGFQYSGNFDFGTGPTLFFMVAPGWPQN